MTVVRDLVVCADDAGWDAPSDEAIMALASAGRVSAVSVLVHGPNAAAWRGVELVDNASLGAHLELTWSATEGSNGLGRLIAQAYARRLPRAAVKRRLEDQLKRFEALFGRPPDFVDGHQHVHALPGVREPLLALLDERYAPADRPAVRVPLARRWRGTKAALIGALGAGELDAELRRRAWPGNDDFAGAYDMGRAGDFRPRMRAWLATLRDHGLIMVHPGVAGAVEHGAARAEEAAYLSGPDWPDDLAAAAARLRPFRGRRSNG